MISSISVLPVAGGVLSGVTIHYGLFVHGEWHVQAPDIVRCYGWLLACFAAGRWYYGALDPGVIFHALLLAWGVHVLSLLCSIVAYRLFFHRLTRAGFVGPLGARISKLWHVWHCRGSKNYLVLDRLHTQYGNFVRTGESMR